MSIVFRGLITRAGSSGLFLRSSRLLGTRLYVPLSAVASVQDRCESAFSGSLKWKLGAAIGVASALSTPLLCDEAKKEGHSFIDKQTASYEDRLRAFSTPDKLFRYFATVEIDGVVFMKPEDFLRALTPGKLQPKGYGLDSFEKLQHSYGHVKNIKTSPVLFSHDNKGVLETKDAGLISYGEFLFLLTALITPSSHFKIAFTMFDIDGNGIVDLEEFTKVQLALQRKTPTGKRIHGADASAVSKASLHRSQMLQTFFGPDGKDLLTFDNFSKYIAKVQANVLHLDFLHWKDRPEQDVTSELGFAKVLLHYAKLTDKERPVFYDRIRKEYSQTSKGVTFAEAVLFFDLLRSIDQFEMALNLFYLAGVPVSEQEFKRAAKAVSGVILPDHIVHLIFILFDSNGDGELDKKEFVKIMKDAAGRGLNRAKDLGVIRGFRGFVDCLKIKAQQLE